MTRDIWTDSRSGTAGCSAGNVVLRKISKGKEVFDHLKGTVFASEQRIVVGRICGSEYLATNIVHFSNVSMSQHETVGALSPEKPVFYLLITIQERKITYWLVPYEVVGNALQHASKKADASSILRVHKEGRRYLLNGANITTCYGEIKLNHQQSSQMHAKKGFPITIEINGQAYSGKMLPA